MKVHFALSADSAHFVTWALYKAAQGCYQEAPDLDASTAESRIAVGDRFTSILMEIRLKTRSDRFDYMASLSGYRTTAARALRRRRDSPEPR